MESSRASFSGRYNHDAAAATMSRENSLMRSSSSTTTTTTFEHNLSSILNNPQSSRSGDASWLPWLSSSSSSASVVLPEFAPINTSARPDFDVNPSLFHPYLTSVSDHYSRFQDILNHTNNNDADTDTDDTSKEGEALVACLRQVPSLYFKEDFRLEDGPTFLAACPFTTLSDNLLLQERLSHYLDVVEMHLVKEISLRSNSFFLAQQHLQDLSLKIVHGCNQIRDLKETVTLLDSHVLGVAKDIQDLSSVRLNLLSLHHKLHLILYVNQALTALNLLVTSADCAGALDVADDLHHLLNGDDLTGLHCFRHLRDRVAASMDSINSILSAEFMRASLHDAGNFDALIVSKAKQRALTSNNGRLDDFQLDEGESSYIRDRLLPIIIGLLRTAKLPSVLRMYRDTLTADMKTAIKTAVAELLPVLVARVPESDISGGERTGDTDGGGSSLASRLRSLSTESFIQLLSAVFKIVLVHLVRAAEVKKSIEWIMSNLDGHYAAESVAAAIAHGAAATESVQDGDSTGNSLVAYSLQRNAMQVLTSQGKANDVTSQSNMSKNFRADVLRENAEGVFAACDAAHGRWAKLLGVRAILHPKIRLQEFLSIYSITQEFINATEKIGGRLGYSIRGTLQSQAKAFVDFQHESRAAKIKAVLDQETWSEVDVPDEFQTIVTSMLSSDLLRSESDVDDKDGEVALSNGEMTMLRSTNESVSKHPLEQTESSNVSNGTRNVESSQRSSEAIDMNRTDATITSARSRNSSTKTLVYRGVEYHMVNCGLILLKMLSEYIDMNDSIPTLSAEIVNRVVDVLKFFNTRSCQLVLGAHAMQVSGLKSITSKHLALASQVVSFVYAIIPDIRRVLFLKVPENRKTLLQSSLDQVAQDYKHHQDEIHNKLVQIMSERLLHHLRGLPQIVETWNKLDDSDTQPSQFAKSLTKEVNYLQRILSRMLHEVDLNRIFGSEMKRLERAWMYERLDANKRINIGFANGVVEFIRHAKGLRDFTTNKGKIRCPCSKCNNTKLLNEYDVKTHLTKSGFCNNYYHWVCHGEDFPLDDQAVRQGNNPYWDMVNDALRDTVDTIREEALNADEVDETPNPQVISFFEMLRKAEEPLYEGCTMSVLQAASRLLTLKCEHNLSHRCVDGISSLIGDVIPNNNNLASNFYETKKLLKGLQLPHRKIDCCPEGCMLFWNEYEDLDACAKCGVDRFKPNANARGKRVPKRVLTYFPLAPRLQRLYATKHVAEAMRWHSENPRVPGTMSHPSDAESWKHFDATYPEFPSEPRNVRLGLCTDGFAPFGQFGKTYSCWPVMLTPYNLPRWLCLKKQFIFLSLIVPGPKNPKKNLDVYLQPLIHELKELWETGIFIYDVSRKQNFQLKAALMWTINDFPAYGMLSRWSTAGEKACPYCGEGNKSFWLKHSAKWSWFDCHRQFLKPGHPFRKDKGFLKCRPVEVATPPRRLSGDEVWSSVEELPTIVDATDAELKHLKSKRLGWWKRSIFWDLPYWKNLLIRHNLDVMHIEKNFFEQVIHTIMDVKFKTCYGPKGKLDLQTYCHKRVEPKFVLDKQRRKVLCDWLTRLKFPDGYASDLSRCVDQKDFTLRGLKSHDCHVFMERLLSVALRELIPKLEWNAFTEISQFFRDLCASKVNVEDVDRLDDNIAEILCKLEKILPPSFFNSMEHLPVHLPYELKVGGPIQYRWMYPFERFLNHIKQKIGNKAFVEGSICNAYLLEEISNFCSIYYEDHVDTKTKDLGVSSSREPNVGVDLPELFLHHGGRTTGKCRTRFLDDKEYNCAHKYVLSNCEILRPYEVLFENFIGLQHPQITSPEIWAKYDNHFPKWFKLQVDLLNNDVLKALAIGPSRQVKTWRRYSINGYNFRTFSGQTDVEKSTINNGVCVSLIQGADYYGTLVEVLQLEYVGSLQMYRTTLFKCDWLDNSERGMNVDKNYKLVDVHRKRKYATYDPFVLAHQVEQVYFAPYPSLKKDKEVWSAVFKTKARSNIDAPVDETAYQEQAVIDVPRLSEPVLTINDDVVEDYNVVEDVEEDDEMSGFIVDNEEEEDEANDVVEEDEEEEHEEVEDDEEEEEEGDEELFPDDDS